MLVHNLSQKRLFFSFILTLKNIVFQDLPAHLKIMLPTNYSLINHIHMYMYKHDLALNDPQGLICHKTQPN